MFDFLQIFFWLIQAALIGLWLSCRIFNAPRDIFCYSPIVGFSLVLIFGNLLWLHGVDTMIIRYLFVACISVSLFNAFKFAPKKNGGAFLAMLGGVFLVILHGSLMPMSEKLFQAYPFDRFSYLASSIEFERHGISYFEEGYRNWLKAGIRAQYSLILSFLWRLAKPN